MFRDPCRKDHTIWTAVAPEEVFTVRTYGTGPLYNARLVCRSGQPPPRIRSSANYSPLRPTTLSQVRPRNWVKFVKTAHRYCTIQIQAGQHTITAADPLPDDLRQALNAINRIG